MFSNKKSTDEISRFLGLMMQYVKTLPKKEGKEKDLVKQLVDNIKSIQSNKEFLDEVTKEYGQYLTVENDCLEHALNYSKEEGASAMTWSNKAHRIIRIILNSLKSIVRGPIMEALSEMFEISVVLSE